jgi:hypothetical protein
VEFIGTGILPEFWFKYQTKGAVIERVLLVNIDEWIALGDVNFSLTYSQ